ncbi:MAG: regulatory protein RecX [Parahaliea sp.]
MPDDLSARDLSNDHHSCTQGSQTDKYKAIRLLAMDLLARREHSQQELHHKLSRRFTESDLIGLTLRALSAEGLQSDLRYAQNCLHQRVCAGWGPVHLSRQLQQKGLDSSTIQAAIETLDVDWCEQARLVYGKKFGTALPVDIKDKARRLRFMQYRGFYCENFTHLLESDEGTCY